jgi:diguanylate cyclase (GGDEF)-like protein
MTQSEAPPAARISRDAFTACLDEAVTNRDGRPTVGLLVVRVHNLHRFNATFGHAVSRRILMELGERLRGIVREHDEVHLFADDEYGLILPNLSNRGHAELAANKALSTVSKPFHFDHTLHHLRVTIGIGVLSDADAETDAAQLLQRAELALASAEDTREPYATYEDGTAVATAAAWDAEAELADAIDNSELELYYQPQLDIAETRICGAEGLMRWHHPRRGFLTPKYFIEPAEQSSQIHHLTWGALNMALQRVLEWPALDKPLGIAINVSAALLSDPEFADMVINAVGIWSVDPRRLVLEITETALMGRMDKSFATLKRLHDIGINISIDDFGTGYSSFSYFRNLPAREIKIDKCFVSRMLENRKDWNIVESLIDLAHKFDLHVVAEGVADEATLDALRELGCDIAQGYYLAEPMPHQAFVEFVSHHRDGWQKS